MKKPLLLLSLLLSMTNFASTIAIIDSGVDLNQPELRFLGVSNLFELADNGVDDEDNGYIDDLMGWNFINQNNDPGLTQNLFQIVFKSDLQKFYDIIGRESRGEMVSLEEVVFKTKKISDKNFLKQVEQYGEWAHGTHVAGVATNGALNNFISVKAIPFGLDIEPKLRPLYPDQIAAVRPNMMRIIRNQMGLISRQYGSAMNEILGYAVNRGAKVVNGSFGGSFDGSLQTVKAVGEYLFAGYPLTGSELYTLAREAVNNDNASLKSTISSVSGKRSLFVFAAGNDGKNNDLYPVSPAGVVAENSITVAATLGRTSLASFSNYGMSVDVAAPGVGIASTAPNGGKLVMSGTSQATPLVSNLAGQLFNINPRLTASEVKSIIVGTVDYKRFLQGKVRSGGIINDARARTAAGYSKVFPLQSSISMAREKIGDVLVLERFLKKPSYVQPMLRPLNLNFIRN